MLLNIGYDTRNAVHIISEKTVKYTK